MICWKQGERINHTIDAHNFYVAVFGEHVAAWRNYYTVRLSQALVPIIYTSTRPSQGLFKTISFFQFIRHCMNPSWEVFPYMGSMKAMCQQEKLSLPRDQQFLDAMCFLDLQPFGIPWTRFYQQFSSLHLGFPWNYYWNDQTYGRRNSYYILHQQQTRVSQMMPSKKK